MDLRQSADILEILALGIDPVTGKPIPADSICHELVIIRALFACARNARRQGRELASRRISG